MSVDNGRSLRHLSRQLLGIFFRSLENLKPWWVSIVSPINGDEATMLTHLLGFEHHVGLQFLCSAGLLKNGPRKDSYSVLSEQWDLFIVHEKLQDVMENVNKSSPQSQKTFFINYGNKQKLFHTPNDQFNGKMSRPSKRMDISARQWKLHKKISDTVLTLHSNVSWHSPVKEKNQADVIEEGAEYLDEPNEAVLVPSTLEWQVGSILLDKKKHPNLCQLFPKEVELGLPKIKYLFLE